jgi:hypothetical protein
LHIGLSAAGHLYKPGSIGWHALISKCNSVFASAACVAAEGSDDEHPPSANSPRTATAEIERFAILFAFEAEFRLTIGVSLPLVFDTLSLLTLMTIQALLPSVAGG